MTRPARPGAVHGPVTTHPLDARPRVTVALEDGRRLPGVEHARANGGASVHVYVTDGAVLRPMWVRAADVEPRAPSASVRPEP